MINVDIKFNGKKVNPNNIKDVMMKSLFDGISIDIKNKLSSVVCEEHGKRPNVLIEGKDISNLSFKISGCCDSLIKKAHKKIN